MEETNTTTPEVDQDREPFEQSFAKEFAAGLLVPTDLKCVWHTDETCQGKVHMAKMFEKQLDLPVCEKHLDDHRNIMFLKKSEYEVEELTNQTPDWRKEQVLIIKLAKINTIKDDEILI